MCLALDAVPDGPQRAVKVAVVGMQKCIQVPVAQNYELLFGVIQGLARGSLLSPVRPVCISGVSSRSFVMRWGFSPVEDTALHTCTPVQYIFLRVLS